MRARRFPQFGTLLMKSASFDYRRAASLSEASRLLAQNEDARLIAGGQTLVPMMAMRLARPALLIDIGRIPEIQQIEVDDGVVVLGAGVRQARAEADPLVARSLPLLAALARDAAAAVVLDYLGNEQMTLAVEPVAGVGFEP